MEKTYYYKLVWKEDDEYVSSLIEGSLKLKYAIGKVTTPKLGKVFIFKTIDDAIDFVDPNICVGYYIMKVEAIGTVIKGDARLGNPTSEKYAKMFWDSSKKSDDSWEAPTADWWMGLGEETIPMNEYYYRATDPVPKGTYLADAVLPVKIMK